MSWHLVPPKHTHTPAQPYSQPTLPYSQPGPLLLTRCVPWGLFLVDLHVSDNSIPFSLRSLQPLL